MEPLKQNFLRILLKVLMLGENKPHVDQTTILNNLRKYLRNNGRDEDFIKQLEEGYCSGISSLWLYAKWLETQPNPDNKPRDDYTWFKFTEELIATWDGKRALTEKESAEFERFVSYIQYFQHIEKYLPIGQGELDKSLEDTKKRVLKKEYSIASLFTLEQLKQLLNTENFIQEGKLIHISSHNHAIALFKWGNLLYCFDPNSVTGEIKNASTDVIARLIFDANEFYVTKPSPLGFRMFSFDEEFKEYPTQKEILDKIAPTLDPITGYADETSGLMQAARVDSLESVEFFLEKKVDPNKVDIKGWTALMLAAHKGNIEIIKALFEENADVNKANRNGWTALMFAAQKGYTETVRFLVNNGADVNQTTPDGLTALWFATLWGAY